MVYILIALAAWFAFLWGRLICRRLLFVCKLRRTCAKHKIRLVWERNCLASLFGRRGKIDFVLDEKICVAILSTIHRRVRYHFFSPTRMRTYILWLHPIYLRRKLVFADKTMLIPFTWYRLFLDEAEKLPKGKAKVLLIHPIPYALARIDGSRIRLIGNDEPVHGGFEVNTRTHFFNQLETYARTGNISIWIARDPRKE